MFHWVQILDPENQPRFGTQIGSGAQGLTEDVCKRKQLKSFYYLFQNKKKKSLRFECRESEFGQKPDPRHC